VNVIHSFEIADDGRHSDRVTRKRQARLRQIAREALALASEEGSDALTLQRLADRLDYTPGALYRYFASKEALIAELQRVVLAWLGHRTEQCTRAALAAAPELPEGPRALLGVLSTACAFEAFAHEAPIEFGLLSMHLGDPEHRLPDPEAERVYVAAAELLSGLAARLETAAATGALRAGAAHARAVALWAALQGAVQTRKLARSAEGRIDPRDVSRELLTTLLLGWGSDADTVAALLTRADAALAEVETASLDELLAIDS
jgi:AcrR family transcriptional regulator